MVDLATIVIALCVALYIVALFLSCFLPARQFGRFLPPAGDDSAYDAGQTAEDRAIIRANWAVWVARMREYGIGVIEWPSGK